jgi:hypothetical protein
MTGFGTYPCRTRSTNLCAQSGRGPPGIAARFSQIENGCGGTATLSAPGSKLKGVSCGEMNENSSQLRDLEKSKFNENAESEVGLRYLSE